MVHKKSSQTRDSHHNVSQNVYIKLDGYEKKSKKSSKRRKRRTVKKQYEQYIPMQIPFPAPVIYQSSSTIPYPIYRDRPVSTDINPPSTKPFLEDIGTIGTEGRVEIMDRPTKKEQLSEFITPVPIPEKVKRYRQETERAKMFWEKQQQETPIKPEIKPQLPIPATPKPISFSMFEQPKISVSETLEPPPIK